PGTGWPSPRIPSIRPSRNAYIGSAAEIGDEPLRIAAEPRTGSMAPGRRPAEGLDLVAAQGGGVESFAGAERLHAVAGRLALGIEIERRMEALVGQDVHLSVHRRLPHAPSRLRVLGVLVDDLGQSIHQLDPFSGPVGPLQGGPGLPSQADARLDLGEE